jgi:hypothetical protein
MADIPDVSIMGEVAGTPEKLGVAPDIVVALSADAIVVDAPPTDIPPPS